MNHSDTAAHAGAPLAEKCHNCSGYEEKIQARPCNEMDSELAEMEKHEVLCCMSNFLGSDPASLAKAEMLFEQIKYQVTDYVIKHEFNRENQLSVELALWLEEQRAPQAMRPLQKIIQGFLKKSCA